MVKIVTDSTSDLPHEVAKALGIVVVPAYVHFSDKSYRDGIDIGPDELYQRMLDGPVHPTTSAPAPGDFAEAYGKLAQETDEIVSIVVTSNRPPSDWLPLFPDPVMANSALDRLAHNAHHVVMKGDSYRKRTRPQSQLTRPTHQEPTEDQPAQ